MKFNKACICILATAMMFTFNGCKFADKMIEIGNAKDKSLYIGIDNLPDGYSDTEMCCYYYQRDTHIVYFGKRSLDANNAIMNKLCSKDYDRFIYDEETGEFIGIE